MSCCVCFVCFVCSRVVEDARYPWCHPYIAHNEWSSRMRWQSMGFAPTLSVVADMCLVKERMHRNTGLAAGTAHRSKRSKRARFLCLLFLFCLCGYITKAKCVVVLCFIVQPFVTTYVFVFVFLYKVYVLYFRKLTVRLKTSGFRMGNESAVHVRPYESKPIVVWGVRWRQTPIQQYLWTKK